jgi:hypothetical protein
MDYKHVFENPHRFSPKFTNHIETHTDFYVSPRKFIRYHKNEGKGFTYCDNFQTQALYTVTQNEDMSLDVKIEFRLEILKFFIVQKIVIIETERQVNEAYEQSFTPFFEQSLVKSLREYN